MSYKQNKPSATESIPAHLGKHYSQPLLGDMWILNGYIYHVILQVADLPANLTGDCECHENRNSALAQLEFSQCPWTYVWVPKEREGERERAWVRKHLLYKSSNGRINTRFPILFSYFLCGSSIVFWLWCHSHTDATSSPFERSSRL
jgi:hypothetical protein